MRIVYVLKRDAIPNIVLNKLYKYTRKCIAISLALKKLIDGLYYANELLFLERFYMDLQCQLVGALEDKKKLVLWIIGVFFSFVARWVSSYIALFTMPFLAMGPNP